MNSNLCSEPAKDGEASILNCETPVKKVSVQAQLPSKFFNERLATPRVRCAFVVDEARALRYRRPAGTPGSDHYTTETEVLVSASLSGNYQKPWPSRKGAGVEELVKYMSSVPCYLQRIEKGENIQEKALNFGVIDWRRLEKWTSIQKTNPKNVVSSIINKVDSLSVFTNQSCSYSGRSSSNSPSQRKQTSCRSNSNSPTQRKQTSSLDGRHWDRSVEKSRCLSHPPNSRTSLTSGLFWSNHEKCHNSTLEGRTSMQTEAGSLIEEKSKSYDQQSSARVAPFSDRQLERNFVENGCPSDHLQESGCVRSKTLSSMQRNTLPGKLPQIYSHQSIVSHDIPYSGLLSSMFQSEESNMRATALPTKNGVTLTKLMTKNEESNQRLKGISEGRKEPLPKHPSTAGLKWLNRSSSLKNVQSSHQLTEANGLDISDDQGRSNNRDRRSPLRRILDPLLKPKCDGNSGPNASSTGKESISMKALHRSSDVSIDSSNSHLLKTANGFLHDERHGVSIRKALVKHAWKNGQPLFMFSTNDNIVLVASMRRTNRLGEEDSNGVYKIVTAQESKKCGIWIGRSRKRKPNLLYDVVGRMEISCSKLSSFDSKNLEVSKQFVLVGDELLPSQGCCDNSVHGSELAAIVVKAPYQKFNALCRNRECENLLVQDNCSSIHIESLQVEKYPEYSRQCSISAILSNGIHGFSDTGKPSTIIERWKSGGSCDCGGWDEGCSLTVLTDRLREMKVSDQYPTIDGILRPTELFNQGGKAGSKHAFSMIAFKEGLYTVEFGSSITSLQAFAICIATLHSRISFDSLDYSAKNKSLEGHLYDNYPRINSMENNGGPTSYELHHPPFSPFGRS